MTLLWSRDHCSSASFKRHVGITQSAIPWSEKLGRPTDVSIFSKIQILAGDSHFSFPSPGFLPGTQFFTLFFPLKVIITCFWHCIAYSRLYCCDPSSSVSEGWTERWGRERISGDISDGLGEGGKSFRGKSNNHRGSHHITRHWRADKLCIIMWLFSENQKQNFNYLTWKCCCILLVILTLLTFIFKCQDTGNVFSEL